MVWAWQAAVDVIRENGVKVRGRAGDEILLSTSRTPGIRMKFRELPPSATAADIARSSRGLRPLVVAPRVTEELVKLAESDQIGFVATKDRVCMIDGLLLPVPERPRGKKSYTVCAVARLMLASTGSWWQGPPSVTADGRFPTNVLSSTLNIGQSQVSVLLRQLPEGSVTATRKQGWVVYDFDGLWDWHLNHYRGPWGMSFDYRSTTRKRRTQVKDGHQLMSEARTHVQVPGPEDRDHVRPIFTGEEAFEVANVKGKRARIDPGRRGPVIVLGEVAAEDPLPGTYSSCRHWDATLRLAEIADPFLRLTAQHWGSSRRTDPLVTAWTMQSETDREMLREWAAANRR